MEYMEQQQAFYHFIEVWGVRFLFICIGIMLLNISLNNKRIFKFIVFTVLLLPFVFLSVLDRFRI